MPDSPDTQATPLPAVEIAPAGAARAAVVWLHGLGADGHDFEPLVPELGLVEELGARFVLPHAPSRPVTLNGGMVMPAWYDIHGLDRDAPEDGPGIRAAAAAVAGLVRRELDRGIPPERVVLAGFSQGGAVALHLGARHVPALGGILGLSTYLPLADTLEAEAPAAARAAPVMLMHGTEDPVVPFAAGERARDRLGAAGFRVEWRSYAMGHSLCREQIPDIRAWLAERLR